MVMGSGKHTMSKRAGRARPSLSQLNGVWYKFGYYLSTPQKMLYTGIIAFLAAFVLVVFDTIIGAAALLAGIIFVWNDGSFTEREKKWFVTLVATTMFFSFAKIWGAIILLVVYVLILVLVWHWDFSKGFRFGGVRGGLKKVIQGRARPVTPKAKRRAAFFMTRTLLFTTVLPTVLLVLSSAVAAADHTVKHCEETYSNGWNPVHILQKASCTSKVQRSLSVPSVVASAATWVTAEVKQAVLGDLGTNQQAFAPSLYANPNVALLPSLPKTNQAATYTVAQCQAQGFQGPSADGRTCQGTLATPPSLLHKDVNTGTVTLSLPGLLHTPTLGATGAALTREDLGCAVRYAGCGTLGGENSGSASSALRTQDTLNALTGVLLAPQTPFSAVTFAGVPQVYHSTLNTIMKTNVVSQPALPPPPPNPPTVDIDELAVRTDSVSIGVSAEDEDGDLRRISVLVEWKSSLGYQTIFARTSDEAGSLVSRAYTLTSIGAGEYRLIVSATDSRQNVASEVEAFTVGAIDSTADQDVSFTIEVLDANVSTTTAIAGVTNLVFTARAEHSDAAPTTPIKYVFAYGDGAKFETYGQNGEAVTAEWRYGIANETKTVQPIVTASYKSAQDEMNFPVVTVNGNLNGTGPEGDSGKKPGEKPLETAETFLKSKNALYWGLGLAALLVGVLYLRSKGLLDTWPLIGRKPQVPGEPPRGGEGRLAAFVRRAKERLTNKSQVEQSFNHNVGLPPSIYVPPPPPPQPVYVPPPPPPPQSMYVYDPYAPDPYDYDDRGMYAGGRARAKKGAKKRGGRGK